MKDVILQTPNFKSIIHCGAGTFSEYAPKRKDRQLFVVTASHVFSYYRRLIWQTLGDGVPVAMLPAV